MYIHTLLPFPTLLSPPRRVIFSETNPFCGRNLGATSTFSILFLFFFSFLFLGPFVLNLDRSGVTGEEAIYRSSMKTLNREKKKGRENIMRTIFKKKNKKIKKNKIK